MDIHVDPNIATRQQLIEQIEILQSQIDLLQSNNQELRQQLPSMQSDNLNSNLQQSCMPEATLLLDSETKVVSICKAYTDTSDLNIVGRLVTFYIHPENQEMYMNNFNSVWQTQKNTTFSHKMCDGKYYNSVFIPVIINKQTRFMLILATEIFPDNNTNVELNNAKKELKLYHDNISQLEHLASLNMLSATMAHELNQPISSIRLLIEDSIAEHKQNQCKCPIMDNLMYAISDIHTATEITRRFRNIARPDKNSQTHSSLAEICKHAGEVLKKPAEHAKLNIDTKGLHELPEIPTIRGEMDQLFFIMIENAIQATDCQTQNNLTITGDYIDGIITLKFIDNCSGIEPDDISRIFEPFFTTKPPGHGTGFGLSIAQRILNNHRGSISGDSKPGVGTTFTVSFPQIAKDNFN